MKTDLKRWLYLPVEISVREFDARLLVACLAVERGYNAVIGMKVTLTQCYPMMPRGIIFDRSLSMFREADFRNLYEEGFRICATDEETFAFYITPESILKQRVNANNLAIAEKYFAWGKHQADIINEAYPGYSEKIINTGCYRNDLNLPKFQKSLWDEDVQNLKKQYGKYILLPANFSEIENNHGGRKFTIDQMFEQGAITTEKEAEFFEDFLDHKEKNLKGYKDVIPAILQAFPDHKLIIRPHPGECHEHWYEFAKSSKNILVIHEGPVTPWLIAADVVFHHGCSTGLETYLLNRPSIAYHPILDEKHDVHLSTKLGPIVQTPEALIKMMQCAIIGNELPRNDVSWLDNYMHIPDDNLVSESLIDVIDSINISTDRMSLFTRLPEKIKLHTYKKIYFLKNRLKRIVGCKVEPSHHTKKWGYMTPEDIKERMAIFHDITGRFANIEVEKIYGQMFLLHSR